MLPARISGRRVAGARRIGGGDINEAYLVELDGGLRASHPPPPARGEQEAGDRGRGAQRLISVTGCS